MDANGGNALLYVTDDDAAVRNSIALLLESYGWQVKSFADGQQCLDAVLEQPPAAIVADLRMPVLGAIDLYTALVERGLCIPFVVLTVYGEASGQLRFPEGIVELLDKPCDGQMLDAAVRRVVTRMNRMVSR